jgi:hypothetical protein
MIGRLRSASGHRSGSAITVAGLLRPTHRLRNITGFVTTYGEDNDIRLQVFARIWHVLRVVRLARSVAGHRAVEVDLSRVRLLAWLHDLNRWPFAHNSERGFFDQAANTRGYLAHLDGVRLTAQDRSDVEAIQRKETAELSHEADCVLTADAIAGVIEDPLLLVCGLRVSPDQLGRDVVPAYGFDLAAAPWRERTWRLAALMRGPRSGAAVGLFTAGIRALFAEQAEIFMQNHLARHRNLELKRVIDTVVTIKEKCIRPIVFPINNELVCRASWLRTAVMPWYLDRHPREDLVRMTEGEFVGRLLATPGCPFRAEMFVPRIDIVDTDHPELRFRL